MADDLFYEPEVLKVIRAILRSRGFRGEENLWDGTQEVTRRCLEQTQKTGKPPNEVPEAIAIARPIANNLGVDGIRTRARHGRMDQGSTADADQHARERPREVDPVDRARLLASLGKVLTPQEMEDLVDYASGVPQTELAADRGMSAATFYKRFERVRKKALREFRKNGIPLGVGFAAALLAVMWSFHIGPWREDANTAGRRPRGSDRSLEVAAEQRVVAIEACKERDWDRCERALDRAKELDPQGDRAAEVKALRETIAAGRRGTAAGDGGLPR
jgi:DNA-directed RNA polymerase specialized sigma24 family protein